MKKLFSLVVVTISSLGFSFAQGAQNGMVLSGETVYQNVIKYLFNPILQLITVTAFLYFLFGVMMFIWRKSNGGEGEDINDGKRHLVYGMVGLFIVFSINGILYILNTTVGGLFQ